MEKARYDVFLSHATLDKPAVEELARLLKKRGFEPWLDKWNLIPGEPWQEAIEKALENCTACAVCLGPSGTGPWQNEEMRAAIDRRVSEERGQIRVIPVLLPGAERGEPSRLPAFLRATTWVEFRETLDDEKALHRLDCGIRGIPPGSDPGEAVAEGACPYRGLQVFDVGDALFFFGREALTGWLLDKLRTDRTGNRFLAIVGPSGSGKSSLARAGLVANLKRGEVPGSDTWPVAICKPGAQPLESLAVALAGAARLGDSPSAVRELIRDLGTDSRMLHLTTRVSLREAPADQRLVVFVDQFEEIFTLCPDEAQRQAIISNLLHAATAADGQTVVVVTLRADFYGRCAAYPDLAAAVSDRQSLVGPMTRDELRSAVERPAYLTGCELEGGLADLLLNEVAGQLGSLPLLEHALLQIWQRREGGRRLTVAAYHEIGGVAGALERHAEEVYSGFTDDEKEAGRLIFLRLVQVDEQGRATKRRLALDELTSRTAEDGKAAETVVARLVDARLLTSDQEKRSTVELAHEALLANWDRLKQWIEQDRDALRTRRRLDEAVAEWLGKDRDPSFLLEGGRLAQAEEWAAGHSGEIGPDVREFFDASVAGRDEERQRERDQAKSLEEEQRRRADAEHQRAEEQTRAGLRLKRWTIAFAVTTTLAIAAALAVFHFRQASERQRMIALAGDLAERSGLVLKKDPMLGLLLATKSMRLVEDGGQSHLPSVEIALRSALFASQGTPLPTGRIRAAALSAESKRLALAGTDGFVSVWSLEADSGPIKVGSLPKNLTAQTHHLAVGPKGKWILVADKLGNSHLFHWVSTKNITSFLFAGEDWLQGNDPFSPDGRWVLTRGKDSLWRVRSLVQPGLPIIDSLRLNPQAVAFSPNGHWLASSGTEGLWIRDLETRQSVQLSRKANLDPPSNLAFSSDSQWIVTGERPTQAWRVRQGEASALPIFLEHCRWNAPEGPKLSDSFLISRILNIGRCLLRTGKEDIVIMALDPRGETIFAGSSEGMLLSTNIGQGFQGALQQKSPIHLLAAQRHWLIAQSGAEAPRVFGKKLSDSEFTNFNRSFSIAALSQASLQLRQYEQPTRYSLWGPHGSWSLPHIDEGAGFLWRFSPNSRWLATRSTDPGSLLVWPLDANGKPSLPFSLSARPSSSPHTITALAFSPDGRWLASGDGKGESRLWDLQVRGDRPRALTNHNGVVSSISFSKNGRLLATGGTDGTVRISKIIYGQAPKLAPYFSEKHGEPIKSLAFLSGDRLAIGLSDRVIIWTPARKLVLQAPEYGVRDLVSNPKGTYLASVGADGKRRIWYSGNDGDLLSTPTLLSFPFEWPDYHYIPLVSFTKDGNGLETTDGRSIPFRWELRTDKLLATACRAVGRNLTEREWKENIPSEPYREREPCPEFFKAYD